MSNGGLIGYVVSNPNAHVLALLYFGSWLVGLTAGLRRFMRTEEIPFATYIFAIAIKIFLAVNTKCGPRYREESLVMDVLSTFLAHSKGSFVNTAKGLSGLAKLMRLPVEVRSCEGKVRGLLDFVYLIRASLYRNEIAATEHMLQLRDTRGENGFKFVQLNPSKCCLFHAQHLAIEQPQRVQSIKRFLVPSDSGQCEFPGPRQTDGTPTPDVFFLLSTERLLELAYRGSEPECKESSLA